MKLFGAMKNTKLKQFFLLIISNELMVRITTIKYRQVVEHAGKTNSFISELHPKY